MDVYSFCRCLSALLIVAVCGLNAVTSSQMHPGFCSSFDHQDRRNLSKSLQNSSISLLNACTSTGAPLKSNIVHVQVLIPCVPLMEMV